MAQDENIITGSQGELSKLPKTKKPLKYLGYLSLFLIIVIVAAHISSQSSSQDETQKLQTIATYQCSPSIIWQARSGQPMSRIAYEGGGRVMTQYKSLSLIVDGHEVYRFDNGQFDYASIFPELRNTLNDETGFDVNGNNANAGPGYCSFPSGQAILSAVGYDAISVKQPVHFSPLPGPYGLVIGSQSGISTDQFQVAAKCLLSHRDEVSALFANTASAPIEVRKLNWLILTDNTVEPVGDTLSLYYKSLQFSCENANTIAVSGNMAFLLPPGTNHDGPIALGVIDEHGNVYQAVEQGFSCRKSSPDRRLVDLKSIPTDIRTCTDSKGFSFKDFLASIPERVTFLKN